VVERVRGAGFTVRQTVRDTFTLRYAGGGALLRHWLTRIGFLPAWRAALGPDRERELLAEAERRLDDIAGANGGLAASVPMLYMEAIRPA